MYIKAVFRRFLKIKKIFLLGQLSRVLIIIQLIPINAIQSHSFECIYCTEVTVYESTQLILNMYFTCMYNGDHGKDTHIIVLTGGA